MKIIKRTGEIVDFDSYKIKVAIRKALEAVAEQNADSISSEAANRVLSKLGNSETMNIEEIQNVVEEVLMIDMKLYKAGKAYILYRENRRKLREEKHLDSLRTPELQQLALKSSAAFDHDPMREFVYLRTYARWIESKGRREMWIETVDRIMNFFEENEKLETLEKPDVIAIRNAIFNQEVMPSMRLMQFAGDAANRCNVCIYNCSFSAPESFKDLADIMYLSMSGTGVGFSVEKSNVDKFPDICSTEIYEERQAYEAEYFMIDDSKEGWCDALQFCLKTAYEGYNVEFDYSTLRPEGARLKTSGGRSSGPGPLKDLIKFIFSTVKNARSQGKTKLSPLNIHDIICKIGQIVIAGGVRRSALISLSDLSDHEIRDCKNGPIWLDNSQRYLSNNSAIYNKKPNQLEFMEEWMTLAKSGSGERGIFSRSGLKHVLPKRRLDFLGKDVEKLGCNPCVSIDTWIQTVEGPMQVSDLIGRKINVISNGISYPMESDGFFLTGKKLVYQVTTKKGYKIRLTENHPLLKKKGKLFDWTEVKDLQAGDQISLSNHRTLNSWPGPGTFEEGWLIGEIVGDGGIIKSKSEKKSHSAYLRFWGSSAKQMNELTVEIVKKYIKTRSDFKGSYNTSNDTYQSRCTGLYDLCEKYGVTLEKAFTEKTEKTSSEFQRGLIRGFFDADGSVQGNHEKGISIRLGQSDIPRLEVIQRMLYRLGIISMLSKNRRASGEYFLPNGKGGDSEYFCKSKHELIISRDNIQLYHELIGFYEPEKMEKLTKLIGSYKRKPNKENFLDTIKSITTQEEEEVYDVTISTVHEFCANGIRTHNCGEIVLKPFQFCNLTEVICRSTDTRQTLREKVRIATLIGTIQSSFSDFNYIDPKWKINQDAERLLGVSLTGIYDCDIFRQVDTGIFLESLREYSIEVNQEYAKLLNINPSHAITAVKPSGTVSQMVNSSSGIHPRFSEYYIRRIRISSTDPLLQLMKSQGYKCKPEVGQTEPNVNTYVLEFPIKSPEGAVTVDKLSTIEQLENWKMFKIRYTEHNPSVTIYVKPDEWLMTANWVWDNWDYITGLSFLPYSDHIYELAPYEKISEEEYKKMQSQILPVDFSKLVFYEKSDNTDVKKELACVGGQCEI